MNKVEVKEVVISDPITVVGKTFTGDYAKSPNYIQEIQSELSAQSIVSVPNKVFGIYFDNPFEKKPDELRSFQAVFVEGRNNGVPKNFSLYELKGRYLYTEVTGDPSKAIMEGYNALFAYMAQRSITPKSPAACQISTFKDGVVTTEIYIELP